jgi:hypothetical protein
LEGTYARFHLYIPTMCYDMALSTTRFKGSPDLYIATGVDAVPSVTGGYDWGLRVYRNNEIQVGLADPDHPRGLYHISVHCEPGMVCNPTQFRLQARWTASPKALAEESYTSKPGNQKMRTYPMCVGHKNEKLTIKVKNLVAGPGRVFTARDDRGSILLGQKTTHVPRYKVALPTLSVMLNFSTGQVANHGHTLHGKSDQAYPEPPGIYRIPGPLWRTGAAGMSHLVAHYDPKVPSCPRQTLPPHALL